MFPALLLLVGLPTSAEAASLTVDLDRNTITSIGGDADELDTLLRDAIESRLQLEADPELMEKLARANVHAVRGMGVDYASNPKVFAFGLSVGTAVNGSGFDLFSRNDSLLPSNGFTAQAGIMAGLNLGVFKPGDDALIDRFMVFTNAMAVHPMAGDFQADVWTWGLHGQYAIVQPVKTGVFTWGGVDATTGFDLASYSLSLAQGTPIDGGIGTWDATGTYVLKARATTIPVEFSTSASVPGVSMWLGLAGDLAPGARAEREVSLAGDITSDDSPDVIFGNVSAKLNERIDVKPVGGRLFTGFQFDITAVKIYTQLNLSTDKSVGMHAGIRAAL